MHGSFWRPAKLELAQTVTTRVTVESVSYLFQKVSFPHKNKNDTVVRFTQTMYITHYTIPSLFIMEKEHLQQRNIKALTSDAADGCLWWWWWW